MSPSTGLGGTVLLVLLATCVSYSNQSHEKTLTVQPSAYESPSGPQLVTFFDPFQPSVNQEDASSFSRKKRDVATEPGHPGIQSSARLLNDSHNSLVVHWAGKDVIICLAKDMNANSSTSTLYISMDYGGNWLNATPLLTKNSSSDEVPLLDKFFNHPANNGKFVFTDVKNNVIYTTDNYGADFRRSKVLFVPDEISFDPFADETILAYEKNTPEKRLWISKDFGLSWTMAQEYVKSISWDESSHPAKLYIQREEPDEHSAVITSESLFTDHGDQVVVLQEVEEFEIKDDYMFATKKGTNDTLELWISYKHGPFLKAMFPTTAPIKNYHVADVSDGQIFVCLTHENSISNLYVGSQPPHGMESPRFSLSLERIVFYKPNLTWSQSWISAVTEDSFVDLHHLEGLRGVYIASVLKSAPEGPKDKINFNEVVSLVTFDNGGQWEVLKPPEFDDDGNPIYCHTTSINCSLHVSQRLSELYPLYRAVPILTRKSAVGLVLATGTVNNSLKGHLGVFISTDGAVTWRQLLQGNYLFNFGDHGGLIVAVKYYKVGDATDTLLYSTDEGQTWRTYKFYEEKVRVLGLMTEPGENTTVFFIFGSLNGTKSHSWILIKVDLLNAFERKCIAEDYKAWSPWDSKKGRDCLLGKKDVYERRIPSHSCYNGRSYERLVNTTKCICSRIDFECDFGYAKNELDGEKCIKDLSENSPGVKAEWCKPGDLYYNLTKGYRKVPGDECEGGDVSQYLPETRPCAITRESEFMLVAKRDSVLRIDLNDFSHVETLPLLNVRAVIAVDYDIQNSTIYWADVNRDNIMRLRLDGNSIAETLVSTDLKSVEGLAFDWIAKNLYFCDGANARIEVIRTDASTMGRMRKVILQAPTLDKPRGVAVHPQRSYIFWTDWSSEKPCIGRSWLDGSHVERIVENTADNSILKWPNGIAVDYETDRIYWVDALLDQMVHANLDGKDVKVLLKGDLRIKHPFGVAVFKGQIYWDDWTTHSIYSASKTLTDASKEVFLVTANHTRLMDLKVYGPGRQNGTNSCATSGKSSCTHLCLSQPGGGFSCDCPDGLVKANGTCVCPDGSDVSSNGLCSNSVCLQNNTFTCATNKNFCIPLHWKCDGDDDCGDNSDEDPKWCNTSSHCTPAQFQCKASGTCIPDGWKCDYDRDCPDGSDEESCDAQYPKCEGDQHFQCANKRCILSQWRCDGDNDCMDNSDELNCTSIHRGSCAVNEFQCEDTKRCISDQWRCDGDTDCPDGSDEKNCTGISCPSYKFSCKTSKECIMQSWRCDGDKDCSDGSDEENCTATDNIPSTTINPFTIANCSAHQQMFECVKSGKCIPLSWRCDKQVDCGPGDESDEMGCDSGTTETPAVVTMAPPHKRCPIDHWQCDNLECIRDTSVCDGYPDCSDSSDEKNCHDPNKGPTGCSAEQVRCGMSNVCVAKSKVCDGKRDCPNNADESACVFGNMTTDNPCNSGQHLCDDEICVALWKVCDGKADCTDGTDEKSCDKWEKVYQVEGISPNTEGVEAHEIEIEWWVNQALLTSAGSSSILYLPSICEIKSGHCTNHTTWIKDTRFTFRDLSPFTKYRVSVYAQVRGKAYPPSVYETVNTVEYEPSEPYGLEIKQPTVDELCATWKKPHTPNGVIKKYILYFSPPTPPATVDADTESVCISNKQSDPPFQSGTKYSFWVQAMNSVNVSVASTVVTYTFKSDAGEVIRVTPKDIKRNSVLLAWTTKGDKNNYFHYNITLTTVGPRYYRFQRTYTSPDPYITIPSLSPGTEYTYKIYPIHKEGIRGTPAEGSFKTLGEPLPKVDGVVAKEEFKAGPNQYSIYWTYPTTSSYNSESKNWEFAVFYGKSEEDLAKNDPIIVKKFPVLLKDLEACENYFADVAVVENGAYGPLTEDPAHFITQMDDRAPPKRLKALDPHNEIDDVTVTLKWESPCPEMKRKIGYNITLKDLTLNHEYGQSNVSYSTASHLEHKIDVQYGGRYEVTVSTSVVGARKSDPVYVTAPDIPYPMKLHRLSKFTPPTVTWDRPRLPLKVTKKGDIAYTVWLSTDEKFSHSKTFVTNETVFSFNDVLDDGGIYYVAVSVRDAEGLESPRSDVITLQNEGERGDPSAVTLTQNSLVGIVVTVIVVLAVLLAALAVFAVRHKRLQTSFLNFASSHYSTQSGSATFQQSMEEHDSPVIRGFSDDEPLLVA